MISFEDIAALFAFESCEKFCIEVEFLVKGYPEYQHCWMGKTPSRDDNEKYSYWYGLVPGGSEAYDYDNFQDFSSAAVFDGKSLKEVWNHIDVLSIDGCDPEDRIKFYLA